MDKDFYVNGKPLISPPKGVHELFEEVLERNQLDKQAVMKLDEKPVVYLVEIEGLTSMYLDRDPIFQSLLNQIKSWNSKVMSYRLGKVTDQYIKIIKLKDIPQAFFYNQLFKSLGFVLNEIAQTQNRQKQIQFTEKACQWYYSQLKNSEKANAIKMLEDNAKELIHFKYKELPESAYKSSLEDFYSKFRSIHTHIEPPEDRVKSFQRKNLLSAMSTTMTRPGTSQNQIPDIAPLGNRPQTSSSFGYRMAEQLSRPRTNLQATRSQINTRSTQREELFKNRGSPFSQRAQSPLKSEKIPLSDDEGLTIAPEKKTFIRDEDTQRIYERPAEIQKLGDLKSTFLVHDPIGDNLETGVNLQSIYFQKQNDDLRSIREDKELINHIQEWANNKGRVDEMIMHKTQVKSKINQNIQTISGTSKFGNVGIKMSQIFNESQKKINDDEDEKEFQNYMLMTKKKNESNLKRLVHSANTSANKQSLRVEFDIGQSTHQIGSQNINYQEKVIGLEQKIKLEKFAKLKQMKGSWLPGGLNEPEIDNLEMQRRKLQSASSYSQKKSIEIGNRTFSAIFRKASQEKLQNDQLDEITKIKNCLARIDKGVTSKILQSSLMIPSGLVNPTTVPLPNPGAGLFENISDPNSKKEKKSSKLKKVSRK